MLSTHAIFTPKQDGFLALLLEYRPHFLSVCLGWGWLHISGHQAAISVHASRSRMAALRGVL